MHNYDNYIHYNYDEGNIENPKELGFGSWLAIGILIVFILFILGFVYYCVYTYNNLIDMKDDVNSAFAKVQSVMQSRVENFSDLIQVSDEATEHLENVFENIDEGTSALSAASTPEELDSANAQITKSINQFINIVKKHPNITSTEQYKSLTSSLERASNQVDVARENYNVAVNTYNRNLRQFPGSILSSIFAYETIELFKTDK